MGKPCGCSGAVTKAAPKFEVTAADGSTIVVRSEPAAIVAAKKSGGTYRKVG